MGSPEVKRSKPCKHDISRRITVRDLTHDMWVVGDEEILPLVLVKVKGHLGSLEVKRSKPCNHNISRRITVRDLILCIWIANIE